MEHQKTYEYMYGAISNSFCPYTDISQFNLTQQQEILLGFYEETDDETRSAMLNDMPILDKGIGTKILKIGLYATEFEQEEIRMYLIKTYWGNIENILDTIFDQAQVDWFKEIGGKSENDEHKLLDDRERYRDINSEFKGGVL